MNKIIILIALLLVMLGNISSAAGFVDCLYSRPDYLSKPSYAIPSYVKIIHLENYVDKNNVLWCHIKFTGFLCFEGWIPVAQLDGRVILGPTKDQGKLSGRK